MNKKLKKNIQGPVRGGAAFVCFLEHFCAKSVIDKTNHYLFFFKFGQEAVILFFWWVTSYSIIEKNRYRFLNILKNDF
jgi:hypothetical protein